MDDAAAIADTHILARESAPGMPPSIHLPSAVHAWLKQTLQSGYATLAAECEGAVVGYARYPADNELADLYVHPSEQGRKVRTSLLGAVKEAIPKEFEPWVFWSHVSARDFYAHHGFMEVGRTDGNGNGQTVDQLD